MMKKFLFIFPLVFFTFAFSAGETLFSNMAFSVIPSKNEGELWVFSRGDVNSGMSLLNLKIGANGNVQVVESNQEVISDSATAVHDGIFSEELSERRRLPFALAGNLGVVLPRYSEDKQGSLLYPDGFFSVRRLDGTGIFESPLEEPTAVESIDSTLQFAVSGLAYDSLKSVLWIARGKLGLTSYDISKGTGDPKEVRYLLNYETQKFDTLKLNASVSLKKYADIFDVKIHPETRELWLATSKGLWISNENLKLRRASKKLDTLRVTGVWIGGAPLQIIAESSEYKKEALKGGIYRLTANDNDFKNIPFLDTGNVVQKKDIFDNSDYSVNNIAFVGNAAFVSVRTIGASVSGILKLDSLGFRAYETDEGSAWLYGFEMGVTDRDVNIMSVVEFPLSRSVMGLAVATYGNGISVSADTGKTWTPILNRAKIKDNLGTVRMVPSVIDAGSEALVSYKVSKDSKITIDVFSYDMKKVRRIVKSAPRLADASRSTNPKEDFWDGKDEYGRPCTMGIYYVRVQDNHGHTGWGKVMTLGGER